MKQHIRNNYRDHLSPIISNVEAIGQPDEIFESYYYYYFDSNYYLLSI